MAADCLSTTIIELQYIFNLLWSVVRVQLTLYFRCCKAHFRYILYNIMENEEEFNHNIDDEAVDGENVDQEGHENEDCKDGNSIAEHSSKIIVLTEEERLVNLDRVQFKAPKAKQIISKHSGTILVKPEPAITLSEAILENATRVFNETVSSQEPKEGDENATAPKERKDGVDQEEKDELAPGVPAVSSSELPALLAKCGFTASRVEVVCNRMYKGPKNMELQDFINFMTLFYAPSFYYGQRLRRFIGRGEMDEAFDLLARGCDVNAGDGEGLCSLHYAAIYNRASAIESLVSYANDTIIVDAVDRYGWSPLHCACQHGNLDCVLKLLNAGANIQLADKNGKTPLHVASCQAKNNIVDALLEKDPSLVNFQDNRGMTATHDAAFKGNEKTYFILSNSEKADLEIKDILGNKCSDYVNIMEKEKYSDGESKR